MEVRGGPLTRVYSPTFSGSQSRLGRNGKCLATVNKIGICYREPCPNGGRYSKQQIPWEFESGRKPGILRRSYFKPYHLRPNHISTPRIKSMTVRSSLNADIIFIKLQQNNRFLHYRLTNSMRATVTCEVDGPVKYVSFFIQGKPAREDFDEPFTIAGDWKNEWKDAQYYAPWKYDVSQKVLSVSCKATGFDESVSWFSASISTYF